MGVPCGLKPAQLFEGEKCIASRNLLGGTKMRLAYTSVTSRAVMRGIRSSRQQGPFNGHHVDILAVRGRSVEDLERPYRAEEINAICWCATCHERDGESVEQILSVPGLYVTDRMERTLPLLADLQSIRKNLR